MNDFLNLLIDTEWLQQQFDAHPRDMWAFTAFVFLLGLALGLGATAFVGWKKAKRDAKIRALELEHERQMAEDERAYQERRERERREEAERERREQAEAEERQRQKAAEKAARKERVQKEAEAEMMREWARKWIMDLSARNKQIVRRLVSGPLVTTYIGRGAFDAIVLGLNMGVEFTELDCDYTSGESSYRLCLNDFGRLATEVGADVLDEAEGSDDLYWLEMGE